MSLLVSLRLQELTLQKHYLQAQLLHNYSRRLYMNPISNVVLQTQLQAINAELDSLHKLDIKA